MADPNNTREQKPIKARHFRVWTERIGLVLGGLVLGMGLLEGGTRIFLASHPGYYSSFDFRSSQPIPYQAAPYFSQDFVNESFEQPGGWYTPDKTILLLPKDFSGKYFNVANGIRKTAFQPQNYQHTIYVVGGSAIYDSEVPDEYTLPSQLQQLFNTQDGNKYRIENLGSITVNLVQQVARLKTVHLDQGDIVIFYDGVNDVVESLYYHDPDGW